MTTDSQEILTESTTKVLLFMPRQLLREGIARLLEHPPEGMPQAIIVGETNDREQALAIAREAHPDLVICRGPQWGFDPAELVASLKEACEQPVPVIVISHRMEPFAVAEALRSGLTAWLSSDIGPLELAVALLAVRAGFMVLGGDAERIVRASLRNQLEGSPTGAGLLALTTRQRQVFDLLAKGLMNKEIAHQLSISRRTVEMHVGNIMTRLGVSSRPQLLLRIARSPVLEQGVSANNRI